MDKFWKFTIQRDERRSGDQVNILPEEIKEAFSDTVIAAGLESEILKVKEETLADRCRDVKEAKAGQE